MDTINSAAEIYILTLIDALISHPFVGGAEHTYAFFTQHYLKGHPFYPNKYNSSAALVAGNGMLWQDSLAKGNLVSIFSKIGESLKNKKEWVVPMVNGKLEDQFPSEQQGAFSAEEWQTVFWKDLSQIPLHKDIGSAAEQILFLLEKHCVTVPSGYHEAISLYDFIKIEAATAICLEVAKSETNTSPFLLVSGGVSGIQEYLYDILSRKASRNLKGRSFFLQLLADTVVMEILERLGLFRTNIIYSTGSGFLLLVPNTEKNRADLIGLKQEISRRLFAEFNTRLYFEMEWHETPDLQPESLQTALNAIHDKIRQGKRRKFSDALLASENYRINTSEKEGASGYDYFFEPLSIKGDEERDAITNEEIVGRSEQLDQDDETLLVKPLTKAQVEIGGLLQDTDVLVSSWQGIPVRNKWQQVAPINSQVRHHLLDHKDLSGVPSGRSYPGIMFSFGVDELLDKNIPESVKGFMLYAGNKVPVYEKDVEIDGVKCKKGSPKVFEHLADDGHTRFKRLGVLRMDVDGLGNTFQTLFNRAKNPEFPPMLAGYSALSRNLDYFFKGYLNKLWENNPKFKNYIQIVYAGGDDLFIIGKWDAILEMAEKIRAQFKAWTCESSAFNLSGGVVLVTPKFPIIKAADAAGEAEDKAKEHESGGEKKDAFTLFGAPLRWDTEYNEVKYLKEQMATLSNEGLLPRGFFSKIQSMHDQAGFQKEKERTEAWRWRIAYDFSRMKERKRGSERLHSFLDELVRSVLTNRRGKDFVGDPQSHHYFVLVNLAAQWADLETRVSNELPS